MRSTLASWMDVGFKSHLEKEMGGTVMVTQLETTDFGELRLKE